MRPPRSSFEKVSCNHKYVEVILAYNPPEGGVSRKYYIGRPRPEVQPVTHF